MQPLEKIETVQIQIQKCEIEIIVEDTELGQTVPVMIDDIESLENLECCTCHVGKRGSLIHPQISLASQDSEDQDCAMALPEVSFGHLGDRRESASMDIMQGFRARKCSLLQVPQPHLDERVVSTARGLPSCCSNPECNFSQSNFAGVCQ